MRFERTIRVTLAVVAVALVASTSVEAASWGQWAGPNRNWLTSEPAGTWPPPKLWEKTYSNSDSSPIIVNGKVYFTCLDGSTTRVYCVNADTGTTIWTGTTSGGRYGRHATGDEGQYYGPLATPACDGTYLFTLSVDGDLQRWNASTGAKGWSRNLYDDYGMGTRPLTGGGVRDFGYTSSPMLHGNNIILEVGGSGNTVKEFRKSDGAMVSSWGSGYPGHSSGPAGPDGKVFISLDKLWINGTQINWKTDWSCNIPTPAASGSYVVMTSGYNVAKTRCYENGSLKWETSTAAVTHSPVIHESAGNVYLPRTNGGRCLNLSNGSVKWNFSNSSCVIVTGDNKVITFDGTIRLNDTNGSQISSVSGPSRGWPSGAFGEGYLVYKNRTKVAVWQVGGSSVSAPAVTTNEASNVTETAARLNGNVTDTGGENPTVTFHWGDNNAGTGTWDHTESMGSRGTGSFYKDISGLSDGTTYYFRAKAVNSGGTTWGTVKSFTTDASISAPSVTTNDASNVTQTAARLNGNVTDTGGENPTVTFHWGDNNAGTGTWDHTESMGTRGAGTFYKDVSGLSAGTTYYCTTKAVNSGGTTWGSVKSFTTQAAASVSITDATDEGLACFKIVTPTATYYYDKAGAGFTSIVDTNNNDWINYHQTGANGQSAWYRGIPNMGLNDFGHPGYTGATSTKINDTTIQSTKGSWNVTWEFFDTHAEMTVNGVGGDYWLLYEGTPGGAVGSDDTCYRSNGQSTACNQSWNGDITNTSGKAAGSEWVYFADGSINRSLFLVHTDESPARIDTYYLMSPMTVFGFGRDESKNPWIQLDGSNTPDTLIIGLVDSKDYNTVGNHIDSIWDGGGPVVNPPVVTTSNASNVTETSARLNGNLNSTGGENPTVTFLWGDNNAGTGSWDHTENLGTRGTGSFSWDISGLTSGTTYYFRARAVNSAGTDWGDVKSFTPTASVTGLVGHWTFDDGSGTTAADSSDNGNDGTIHGATWATGKVGGALSFGGSDADYVEIPNESDYDLAGAVSYAVWIKMDPASQTWAGVVTKGDHMNLQRSDGTSHLVWQTKDYPGTISQYQLDETDNVVDNQWHHVAVTFDGSQKCIYVDGALSNSAAATGTINTTDYAILIGKNGAAAGHAFKGLIDDVRIYDYALSLAEVDALYTAGSSGVTAPVVAGLAASNVTTDAARLNGDITSTGGENPSVTVYWGDNDGVADPANWDHELALGAKGAGGFYHDVSGLNPGATYYYCFWAQNSAGGMRSSTVSFTTQTAGGALPSPWQHADVGAVGAAGDASYDAGTFTVSGSGADIWGSADEFHFVYQTLDGNGEVVARVTSQTDTNGWAKAGVMIRDDLAAGSQHAMMAVTPGNGASMQWRATAGATSNSVGGGDATLPKWVKMVRAGETLTGYTSDDGSTWTAISSQTISMGSTVYVGLCVTSHSDGDLSTATFTDVGVAAGGPTVMAPTVVNRTPSSVTTNAGRLNGEVTATGGEDPTVIVYYGASDGGTNPSAWDDSHDFGIRGAGTLDVNATGLVSGTTYYYRFYASNSAGEDWANASQSFTTDAVADADGDGMDDAWEVTYFGGTNVSDGSGNADGDGLTDLEEFQNGTNPTSADTDGDGLNDSAELATHGTDPTDADSDDDGMADGYEVTEGFNPTNPADGAADADGDGASNAEECQAGTDPFDPDSFPLGETSEAFACAAGSGSAAGLAFLLLALSGLRRRR